MKRENKIKSTINDPDNLPVEEECLTRYYQNHFGIPTHSSTKIAQGMENGNLISCPRI